MTAIELVNQQADDEGLWFIDCTGPEAVLQQALRKLHTLVENEAMYGSAAIKELRELLIARDGGDHDVDCKTNKGRQCNCGHDSVKEYFSRANV